MYCDDADPAEFYTETHPTARKDHMCCECGRVIEPGEIYKRVDGKWGGMFGTYATCADCEAAWKALLALPDGPRCMVFEYLHELCEEYGIDHRSRKNRTDMTSQGA